MSEANNIDSLLVKDMQQAAQPAIPENSKIEPVSAESPQIEDLNSKKIENKPSEDEYGNVPRETLEEENKAPVNEEPRNDKTESPIDEYGNPVDKPKMYTQDEVNRMIRDRLSRVRQDQPHVQQPTQQQIKQATDEFQPDPNSNEEWEVQLENFIDKTIEKKQKKWNEDRWQEQERAKQVEFEDKFSAGMAKYADFESVVGKQSQNITASMMLGARNLDNPAAFVYAAAKMQPKELERIAKISDPYIQAAEIGRLHEKMIKVRNMVSKSPTPLEAPKGDMPQAVNKMPSLEERIHQYAKSKRK